MAFSNPFRRVSQSPTNPEPAASSARTFDVADLYQGPLDTIDAAPSSASSAPLDEKLRQAYFWIVNSAIISPHYDIEYNDTPPVQFTSALARPAPSTVAGRRLTAPPPTHSHSGPHARRGTAPLQCLSFILNKASTSSQSSSAGIFQPS